jgi:hypothetical protein
LEFDCGQPSFDLSLVDGAPLHIDKRGDSGCFARRNFTRRDSFHDFAERGYRVIGKFQSREIELDSALARQDPTEQKLQHVSIARFGEFDSLAHQCARLALEQGSSSNCRAIS